MGRILEKLGFEWTYLLWSPTFFWRCKVGRSTNFDARIRDIQSSMSAEYGQHISVKLFLKMPMFFAGASEKAAHNMILWLPVKNMRGSGRTEWSYFFNFYTAAVVFLLAKAFPFECSHWAVIFVFLAPLPFDFAIVLTSLALLQWGIAGLILYALCLFF